MISDSFANVVTSSDVLGDRSDLEVTVTVEDPCCQ